MVGLASHVDLLDDHDSLDQFVNSILPSSGKIFCTKDFNVNLDCHVLG